MKTITLIVACFLWAGAPLLAAEADEGKELFQRMCSQCHQLPEPDMLKLRQWRLIVRTMQLRMQQAGMPQLTDQESGLVLKYLAGQARK